MKVIVGARATIFGNKLASLGVGKRWLEMGLLVKSLDSTSGAKLLAPSI